MKSSWQPIWIFVGALVLVAQSSGCGRSYMRPAPNEPGAEVCDNGIDDDADGSIDCLDSDCQGDTHCSVKIEDCGNGQDDDANGFVDCQDPECLDNPICASLPLEQCANQIDDNGDGLLDCNDPQCFTDPICQSQAEDCSNGKDDDQDNLIDCDDPQCYAATACQDKKEICGNGIDDDANGFTDCQDIKCANDTRCVPKKEICNNKIDDDGDAIVDCNDVDCQNDPACAVVNKEICNNKIDDDNDGKVDCADADCANDASCAIVTKEICNNNLDDDGDALVDCKDGDCLNDPACVVVPKEICDNKIDDDKDGTIDCQDVDCKNDVACQTKVEICNNTIDDDGDKLADCLDPDCFKEPACQQVGQEICNNGIDDDQDGKTDCLDTDCSNLPSCKPGTENCTNKIDDDKDGAIDCADPDCVNNAACLNTLCQPTVDFGTLAPKDAKVTKTVTTKGTKDLYTTPCGFSGGGEVVAQFKLTATSDVNFQYLQTSGDHVFSLYRGGVSEPCNAHHLSCLDPKSSANGYFSLKGLSAGTYYLFSEAYAAGLEGAVTITLSTGSSAVAEICNNGKDDDLDGALDCADLDCFLSNQCTSQNCTYDINIGSLVVNGAAQRVTISTKNAGDDVQGACSGAGGGDRVIRLVMATTAGLAVSVSQTSWHTFSLAKDLGPGNKCDADRSSCFDSNNRRGFTLVYDAVEKGTYYYLVDALKAGQEGTVTLSFQAFANRGQELCTNQIDDDGDGLVDCDDPDCVGASGCAGPVCQPDYQAGALTVNGAEVPFVIDLNSHNNNMSVPCSLGGGKDAVIAFELSSVSGLGIECSETGDMVFGLFVPGAPRDPCDTTSINCADPKLGPISCNFIMPNLQPGKYYLIVEAFKPGSEGIMDLRLSAWPDHAVEICNNNKDDDGDGKIDCADPKCVGQPLCAGASCTVDKKLGVIPIAGSPVNAAVTTSGAGDQQTTSCSKGGGADVALGFSLLNPANLTIDYAQFGNHVFGIFQNKGAGYACDDTPVSCQATTGAPIGKVMFSGLKSGEYYLVVDAVAAGSEGSVVMQLTAQ